MEVSIKSTKRKHLRLLTAMQTATNGVCGMSKRYGASAVDESQARSRPLELFSRIILGTNKLPKVGVTVLTECPSSGSGLRSIRVKINPGVNLESLAAKWFPGWGTDCLSR